MRGSNGTKEGTRLLCTWMVYLPMILATDLAEIDVAPDLQQDEIWVPKYTDTPNLWPQAAP